MIRHDVPASLASRTRGRLLHEIHDVFPAAELSALVDMIERLDSQRDIGGRFIYVDGTLDLIHGPSPAPPRVHLREVTCSSAELRPLEQAAFLHLGSTFLRGVCERFPDGRERLPEMTHLFFHLARFVVPVEERHSGIDWHDDSFTYQMFVLLSDARTWRGGEFGVLERARSGEIARYVTSRDEASVLAVTPEGATRPLPPDLHYDVTRPEYNKAILIEDGATQHRLFPLRPRPERIEGDHLYRNLLVIGTHEGYWS